MNLNKPFGIFKLLENFFLLLLSVILNFLSHPNFLIKNGSGIIIFISFIPLFYLTFKESVKSSILYGFLFGYLFYFLSCFWLFNFEKVTLFLVPFIKGCEYAIILFSLRVVYKKVNNRIFLFLATLIFVLVSFLLEKGVWAFPYLNPVYALYRHTSIIQCVRFIRIWGLLYFIIIFQLSCVLFYINNKNQNFYKTIILCYFILFIINIFYGCVVISKKNVSDTQLNILAVQHNSPSWNSTLEEYNKSLDTLISLTKEKLEKNEKIDLIVWSETAVTIPVIYFSRMIYDEERSEIVKKFIEFSENISTSFLIGTGDIGVNGEYYNAAILFNKGIPYEKYYKRHLVPFTEYCPDDLISKLLFDLLGFDKFSLFDKGNKSTIFTLENGVKFGATICFEDVFTSYTSELKQKGARFIINLTNDSWGESVVCQNQHLSTSVFRSIENSIPTIRVTNSGVTCLITQNGVIKDTLSQFESVSHIYNFSL